MKSSLKELSRHIDECMLADRHRLRRRLRQLSGQADSAQEIEKLKQQIERSQQLAQSRKHARSEPGLTATLPVNEKQDEICQAILDNQVVILCGETGSGKTTQLPQLCLKTGRGTYGMIGHTQPRRIAARSVASRIAEELDTPLGEGVGYKIRFNDKVNQLTQIKLMTDGILLAEIQSDPYLNQYDTLIIDEAHERSLNIDFILGYLKQLLPRRPDLKIIITSATIDPQRFARHFNDAPVIEVSGRTYPVEVRYRPISSDSEKDTARDQQEAILNAVDELSQLGNGDILVFLSGERQIREAAEALRKHHPEKTEVIPLFSRLSAREQQKVFQGHTHRRIILATNVAETSLTIPGIKYVIDTGYARISRYSYRTKVQRLPIEKISQASANQRKGRCGRVSEGVCIRLYSEEDFENRPLFTDAEIMRTNLANVILQMHAAGLGQIEQFPFIDRPDSRLIRDGYQLLEELQAIQQQRITSIGKRLSRFPIEPRYARMIVAANKLACLNEVLIIVSALSIADPRERPLDKQQQADQAHAEFKDNKSDFVSYLKLWDFFKQQRQHLSQNKLRNLCKKNFLSYNRMMEWRDIHSQLLNLCNEVKYKINTSTADYDAIHQAILTGLLSHIGFKTEDGDYQGAKNTRFNIFPASGLRKKRPQWIMAAEMMETQRHYALTVAQIEPGWIERLAAHLLKKSYFEAHWEKRPQQVAAFEKSTLYGLVINPRKKVNYGPIDPQQSRELFIHGALVNREYNGHAAFFTHNEKLFNEIEKLEHQSRRQDVLVNEEVIYQFYDERIPEGIYNRKSFDSWRKQAEEKQPRLLFLSRDYLMQHGAGDITEEQYPEKLMVNNTALPLSYHFAPGSEDDGVTLHVPLTMLNTLDPLQFEWLIPALLPEKISELIRSLPRAIRKNMVPAPQYASACLDAISDRNQPLIQAVSEQLQRMTGIEIDSSLWQTDNIDAHYFMRFAVHDSENNIIAAGRDLKLLQQQLQQDVSQQFSEEIHWEIESQHHSGWDFAELPEAIEQKHGAMMVKGYPALQDDEDSVSIVVVDTPQQSDEIHHYGLKRLYQLAVKSQLRYLKKNLPGIQQSCMAYASIGSCDDLKEGVLDATLEYCFFNNSAVVRSKSTFEKQLQQGSETLVSTANEICDILGEVFNHYRAIKKQLKKMNKPNWLESIQDIQSQLDHLLYEDFLYYTPMSYLRYYPRYLQGIAYRLDKLQQSAERDRQYTRQLQPWWQHFIENNDSYYDRPLFSHYRWMLEEYRVSLFAQQLKTRIPVSEKRLQKQWQDIKRLLIMA